jgi:hypothetical protein
MSKQSHTPGPWVHHPEDNIITAAGTVTLIECQARSLYVSVEERDANARLMAAAPELLEALRLAYRHLNGGHDSLTATEHASAFLLARAAIAKATGEQP